MPTRDPRIDAYIAKAAPFARPILIELRARVHRACPDAVETIKWSTPAFDHHGPLCGMAAFKAHCVFGFWKHDLVVGDDPKAREAMGSFGRVLTLADLPPRGAFARLVKIAMRLNEQGVTVRRAKRPRPKIAMHPELARALAGSPDARRHLAAMAPSHQHEYLEWIAEAKRDDTRARRIAQALEWLAAGKPRNWKYMPERRGSAAGAGKSRRRQPTL